MTLVELIEDHGGDAAQLRIADHAAQENSLRDVEDARPGRAFALHAHLVTNRLTELFPAFLRHLQRQHACRHTARLEDNDLPVPYHDTIEQHLRNLRGFARAGRRPQNQARLRLRRLDDAVLDLVNGQLPRVHRDTLPAMSTVRQALQSALDENGGKIPFDTFMEIALHHPEDGYYARHIRGIGARGDFTTVPQLTPALGEAIGRWLREEAGRRGWTRFNVIECGPGSGALAASVMKSFGWLGKRKVDLHLVEKSEPLRAEQKARVRGTWHATIGAALASCDGKALIYHNEFLDAFPCRVFRRDADRWTELYLHVIDGKLTENFLPLQRPLPDARAFEHRWPEGQRLEVFESAHAWMKELSKTWREGAMLCIDYGGATIEIYERRPQGTLRAYRGQQRLTGDEVYEMPGRQDITADINFNDLQRRARELGWKTEGIKSLDAIAPGAPGAEAFRAIVFLN
jgi:SAM-dependent MidA family methyltransferase